MANLRNGEVLELGMRRDVHCVRDSELPIILIAHVTTGRK